MPGLWGGLFETLQKIGSKKCENIFLKIEGERWTATIAAVVAGGGGGGGGGGWGGEANRHVCGAYMLLKKRALLSACCLGHLPRLYMYAAAVAKTSSSAAHDQPSPLVAAAPSAK